MEAIQQQLHNKEQHIKDLKQQGYFFTVSMVMTCFSLLHLVENFQHHLMSREQKFSLLNEQEENRVDKDLVKNLILGYFTATSHKKNEVLKLIANILEFSPAELEQVITI